MGHVDFKRASFAAASAAGDPLDPVEAEPLARASGSIGSIAKAEARPSARPEISNLIAAIKADRARVDDERAEKSALCRLSNRYFGDNRIIETKENSA
jgi:hypothetical protein